MLEKISVTSLFGRFDYIIEMKNTGVTIITGPNGYGKSTILKIIEAIWQENINFFVHLDFKTIVIVCSSNQELEIKKIGNNEQLIFSYNKLIVKINKEDMGKFSRFPSYFRKIDSSSLREIANMKTIKNEESHFYFNYLNENIDFFNSLDIEKNMKIIQLTPSKNCP